MRADENTFTEYQTKELEKLFDKFYYLCRKISVTAKTTKMAIELQAYSNQKLHPIEIELALENILEDIKFIEGESAEMSTIPDYLFWEKKNTYDHKTIH